MVGLYTGSSFADINNFRITLDDLVGSYFFVDFFVQDFLFLFSYGGVVFLFQMTLTFTEVKTGFTKVKVLLLGTCRN